MSQHSKYSPIADRIFAGRFLMICAVIILMAIAGWFVWYAINGLLLIVSAIILAIALDGLARAIHWVVPLSRHLSIALASIAVVAALGGVITFGTMNIAARAPQLEKQIAQSVNQITTRLEQNNLAPDWITHSNPNNSSGSGSSGNANDGQSRQKTSSIGKRLSGEFSNAVTVTISTLADAFLIAIIGFYLAFTPSAYQQALVRLVPKNRRQRIDDLLCEVGIVLRRWLVGRGLSMTAVGVGSVLGLSLLNVPFALLLGLIAGLLTFIPYLGAILSAVPAILVAALQGIDIAFYTAGIYLGLHILEGYILAPLIQRRAVSLAPGFLLIAQTLGFAIAGTFGMMVAAPIALSIQVFVQALYIEDVLGDQPHMPGVDVLSQENSSES